MTKKKEKVIKNAIKENILLKKITELTPEDLKALEKPLGTFKRPFPMWGSQRADNDDSSGLEQVLSVIADDTHPMIVYSDRPYKEVVALSYCDMPVPSMLPLFKDGLERRRPESTNRTQMMIGDPGHGKSFLGALQGRLRSSDPVEVFDCGGKNMNELLFEMVLDFGAADALPDAIDKHLKAGLLNPLSVARLSEMPGVTVKGKGKDAEIQSIDWGFFKGTAKAADVEKAFKILKDVSHLEGFDNAGGNALGMNSQYGPLIRWFKEGREGVLDEYNKSREGSDNALQTVWQFMIGEIQTCTVENPLKNKDTSAGPSEFTFRQEDMPAGFFVTLTGNKTEDGLTTRSLNKSVYSRLSPQTLPNPDVSDWQHRICQMMVGLPVSTLYKVFKKDADKDPAAFGQWLLFLRKTKAEMEGTPIPELQETLLSNWQNVQRSSEKLAKFYDKWAQLTDAEKVMDSNIHLVEEIDEEYSKKEGVDFRKIKQHLEEAIPLRPRMLQQGDHVEPSFEDWNEAPELSEKVDEKTSLFFGTRLVDYLDRLVYEKTEAVGKPKLYSALRKAMEQFGLRDLKLVEGARSRQKSVEDDLNISPFNDADFGRKAKMAQKIFCDYVRQVDPMIEADDEQIVTVKKIRDALESLSEKDRDLDKSFLVINRDHAEMLKEPLTPAYIKDDAVYEAQGTEMEIELEELVHHDDFIASLALPAVGESNLKAVWEENLRPIMLDDSPEDFVIGGDDLDGIKLNNSEEEEADESLNMAENKSSENLGITTLSLRYGEDEDSYAVSLHIVRNEERNKTLIVGEKAPSKLLSAFKEAGITHVDRQDPKAVAKIETALADLTRNKPETTQGYLKQAFGYRNDVQENKEDLRLSDLMVDPELEVIHNKYLVKPVRSFKKVTPKGKKNSPNK